MSGTCQYRFGPFLLDPSRRVLSRDGQPLALTARAFDVLVALVERAGRTVDKDELLRAVWPDTVVEEANLSQQIFTIRKLFGQSDESPYIATVPRRGYRFVAAVQERREHVAVHAEAANGTVRALAAVRLAIPFPADAPLAVAAAAVLAISPDGSRVVYAATVRGTTRLFLRPLDRFDAIAIDGTEGATSPFFSADGQWLGFQCGRRLQKVLLAGAPPVTICDLDGELRGASWGPHNDIVFAPGPAAGLCRVAAAGGPVRPVTALQFDRGERTHRWPHLLPDGRGVLFTIGSAGASSFDSASLAVADIEGGGHQIVLQHGTDARYAQTGHMVWARGGTLLAARFDVQTRRVHGPPRVVLSAVAVAATGAAHYAWSSNGVLVHVPGDTETLRRSLVAVDRTGAVTTRCTTGDALEEPRVSPDGGCILAGLRGCTSDVWLYDCARGTLARATFEGENFAGIWGPGAGAITFSSSRGHASDLYLTRPDRSAPPELVIASEFDKVAGSWTADGASLLFTEYHPETGADIWLFDRHAQQPRPFVRTRFNEYAPALSPDQRHVAYTTDESGRAEIQIVEYPRAVGKRQLSTEGGAEPLWSRDGRELFYRSGDRIMRVDMTRGPAHASVPATVFEGRYVHGSVTGLPNYDISPDGGRFFMVMEETPPRPAALLVTIGWFPEVSS